VWDHVHTALSPQGDELSPRGSWGICVPVLPEGLTDIPNVFVQTRAENEKDMAFIKI
jgi:hypothetical protein